MAKITKRSNNILKFFKDFLRNNPLYKSYAIRDGDPIRFIHIEYNYIFCI